MNLMMSFSQKAKMFVLRILGLVSTYSTRNIENDKENVSIMKYIDLFRCVYQGLFLPLDSSY